MSAGTLANVNGRIATRVSNIELLRILCMVMIVAHHLFLHGGIFEHSSENIANLLWGGVFLPGGKIGYDCFIIITAWFCIGKKFKGNRLIKIALEVIFYNIVGMTLATILNNGLTDPITVRNWIGCFSPIFGISHGFAVYYMIFLMILPLLNTVSERMSKRNIQAIIVLAFLMQIWAKVFGSLIDFKPFVDLDNGLFTFIILYFSIVYIKKYPLKIIDHKAILAIAFTFILAFNATVDILSVKYPEAKLFSRATMVLNDDVSPLNMIAAFCLFFLFKSLKISHKYFINFVASHTFGILLLHDHNYFRYIIWDRVFNVENFYGVNIFILIAYTISVVLILFTIGILIDIIREYVIERPVLKTNWYSTMGKALESCFNLQ